MWEAGGDYNDILLDAIRSGSGMPEECGGELFTTTRTFPTVTYPSTTASATSTSSVAVSKKRGSARVANASAPRHQRATAARRLARGS